MRISRDSSGFSLLELLVVMAIIGILSGVAMLGVGSIGRSSGIRGAVDLAASTALSARVEAMKYGHGSLLVVDNGTDPERKLRRLAVYRYTNTPDPGNMTNNTELVGAPVNMPKGIFFNPQYSSISSTLTMPMPPGQSNTSVYFVQFNGAGHLKSPQAVKMVFGWGIIEADGSLTLPEASKASLHGFSLKRNGRPVFYQSAEQILTSTP